jgi:hypothetical protein
MSIATKLLQDAQNWQNTDTAKGAIFSSIEGKGVTVPAGSKLADVPALIDSIQTGGEQTGWQYPSAWPDIKNVGDDEVLLLVTDGIPLRLNVFTSGTGGWHIDFGDGTSGNYVSNSTVVKDYYGASGFSICPLTGRKIWLVRITASGDSHITYYYIRKPEDTIGPGAGVLIAAAVGGMYFTRWSDSSYGPFTTTNTNAAVGSNIIYCKIKSFGVATSFNNAFYNCNSLRKVEIPDSFSSVETLRYAFYNCYSLTDITLPTSWGLVTDVAQLFYSCSSLKAVTLPTSWELVKTCYGMFCNCYSLTDITLPTSWGLVTDVSRLFYNCSSLKAVTLPTSWELVKTCYGMFCNCYSLKLVDIPASWDNVTSVASMFSYSSITSCVVPVLTNVANASSMFSNCSSLIDCTVLGWGNALSISNMFSNCMSLRQLTLPSTPGSFLTDCSNIITQNTSAYIKYINLDYVGSLTADTDISLPYFEVGEDFSVTFHARLSRLRISASDNYHNNHLISVRLDNPNSQFGGYSPQVDVSNGRLSAAALNLLFSDLPTLSGKTIKITGNPGAATCDKTIATEKGWTVTT